MKVARIRYNAHSFCFADTKWRDQHFYLHCKTLIISDGHKYHQIESKRMDYIYTVWKMTGPQCSSILCFFFRQNRSEICYFMKNITFSHASNHRHYDWEKYQNCNISQTVIIYFFTLNIYIWMKLSAYYIKKLVNFKFV